MIGQRILFSFLTYLPLICCRIYSTLIIRYPGTYTEAPTQPPGTNAALILAIRYYLYLSAHDLVHLFAQIFCPADPASSGTPVYWEPLALSAVAGQAVRAKDARYQTQLG